MLNRTKGFLYKTVVLEYVFTFVSILFVHNNLYKCFLRQYVNIGQELVIRGKTPGLLCLFQARYALAEPINQIDHRGNQSQQPADGRRKPDANITYSYRQG